jgi:hypothetical protein
MAASIPTVTALIDSANAANAREAAEREAAAQAHEAKARAAEEERAASFERCDTDGFVSQWASGLTAAKERIAADLARTGGLRDRDALFLLDGTLASTHEASGDYGLYWVLNDEAAAKLGRRFLSTSNARKGATRYRNDEKKGVRVGTIRVRHYADLSGGGRGLGGACSVAAVARPDVDALKRGDFEVVTTDNGPGEDWA